MSAIEENSGDKLVDSLFGKAKPPTNLPALKYGRDMELTAVKELVKYLKKHHRGVLGIENMVSLLIKLNSTWEHPQTY